jgi:hypothetical protein
MAANGLREWLHHLGVACHLIRRFVHVATVDRSVKHAANAFMHAWTALGVAWAINGVRFAGRLRLTCYHS